MSENKIEQLKESLFYKPKNVYETLGNENMDDCMAFCDEYLKFLDFGKTERLCTKYAVQKAQEQGFLPFDATGKPLKPGDKFYYLHRDKAVVLGIMGTAPIEEGTNIIVAHMDTPRLDLKPNPLYEEDGMALFKTHYYGGIKKYQWTALPLALHGVIAKKDGTVVEVSIGDNPDEPAFCITDLLPHLAGEQMQKKMSEGFTGEDLNILVGSIPYDYRKGDHAVKLHILSILHEKYGICEEDFISAELSAVPALPARYIGFDKGLIGAYGHDDRVCGYMAMEAIFAAKSPKRTSLCILADKEEVGSMGITGMQSNFLQNLIADLGDLYQVPVRRILSASHCLSADVGVAQDPNFPSVTEKRNATFLGQGMAFIKYTGSRGKAGSSDASAELIGKLRKLFDEAGIIWQIGELGKVDVGGGGTVAQYIANLDVETIDCGVSVLSMHAPYEVVSCGDVYMTYQGFTTFFEKFHP
jgi:aspartyl aminopeptidase